MSKCSPTRPPPSSGLVSRAVDHAISRLLAHERIRAARHHIERTDEVTLARQAVLSAIPAPTGAEGRRAARVPATRPILFTATVGEEGSGDLRGVKYLLNGNRETGNGKPVAFIALDGAGLDRVIHRALGSKRYHVTFRGPGGHSWAAFGV